VDGFELKNGIPTNTKTPAEVLDFTFDFSDEMASMPDDTITGQVVSASGGSALGDVVRVGNLVTFWLSGGTIGTSTTVECRISTMGGRTIARSMAIAVVARK
jgi:hypothetical protein